MNLNKREREMGEEGSTGRVTCSVLSIDHTNMFYRVCAVCERTISDPTFVCHPSNPPSKRLFRILMSVATDTQVLTVVCFDRVARLLFGCSADEFFHFAKLHPFSGVTVNEILEGEIFTITLSRPVNANAQHLRVASAVPLSSAFRPAIHLLKQCYETPHHS
uniref:Replication factor A C-terminal domain-containing protein n=1 Tax=Glycine max TaxID=3847 RepID=C6T1G5_SOYBN|nr:unknown [Glycine max]